MRALRIRRVDSTFRIKSRDTDEIELLAYKLLTC